MSVRQGSVGRALGLVAIGIGVTALSIAVLFRGQVRAHFFSARLAHSADPSEMADAANWLAATGPAAIGPLRKLLKNPRQDVRIMTIATLGRIGGAKAAQALFDAVHDVDPEARFFAATRLGQLGEQVVWPHIEALVRGNDVPAAMAAVVTLERWQSSAAVKLLREIAAGHGHTLIRAQAIACLGRRREQGSVPLLIEQVADRTPLGGFLLTANHETEFAAQVAGKTGMIPQSQDDSEAQEETIGQVAARALVVITGRDCGYRTRMTEAQLAVAKSCWLLAATSQPSNSAKSDP